MCTPTLAVATRSVVSRCFTTKKHAGQRLLLILFVGIGVGGMGGGLAAVVLALIGRALTY